MKNKIIIDFDEYNVVGIDKIKVDRRFRGRHSKLTGIICIIIAIIISIALVTLPFWPIF